MSRHDMTMDGRPVFIPRQSKALRRDDPRNAASAPNAAPMSAEEVLAVLDRKAREAKANAESGASFGPTPAMMMATAAEEAERARDAVADLIARQPEWLCAQCATVFPSLPGTGPMGVGCTCGGILKPSSQTERMLDAKCVEQAKRIAELEAERDALRKALDFLHSHDDDIETWQRVDSIISAARAEAGNGKVGAS